MTPRRGGKCVGRGALRLGLGLGLGLCAAAATAGGAAAQQSYLLVVSGLGGAPQYDASFYHWGAALVDAAHSRYGLPDSNVIFLAERPDRDPKRIQGRSTREGVERAVDELARRAHPGDDVFIVLIGHGTDEGGDPRLNLPGPDLTAADLAKLLNRFAGETVVVVNTTSSSGGWIPVLAGKDRVIITATRNAGERNETVFGRYFVDALTGDGADLDKDGRVSMLEAFTYARRETARAYQEGHLLLTEHATLDGNGDGVGTMDPDSVDADTRAASMVFFGGGAGTRGVAATPSAATSGASSPEATSRAPAATPPADADSTLRALYATKRTLEARIDSLKAVKPSMEPAAYDRALEALLVELARTDQAIRKAEGGTP